MNISQKSMDFLKQRVMPGLGLENITEDDFPEIVDYIADHFEIPLAQAKEAGEQIDEELLELAAAVITELTV